MLILIFQIFTSYLAFCAIVLRNVQLYEKSRMENKRNQVTNVSFYVSTSATGQPANHKPLRELASHYLIDMQQLPVIYCSGKILRPQEWAFVSVID